MSHDPTKDPYHHISVLHRESLAVLNPTPGKIFVDCTFGGGGHTRSLLEATAPGGAVIAFDRDDVAIYRGLEIFKSEIASGRLRLVHANFGQVSEELKKLDLLGQVDGMLADIGVSSHHLDTAERGFSFQKDGPLDMRMDQTQKLTAARFLAEATQDEISHVLWTFGEEPKSRFIAKLICERRTETPFVRTSQLAQLIASKIYPVGSSRKHPATKTFQALRIFINNELGELEQLIASSHSVLKSGGVLAIISFHSLEDRIIKKQMQFLCGKNQQDSKMRDIPLTEAQLKKFRNEQATLIAPFPVSPSEQELEENPRARSAKLRAIRFL